MTATLERLRSTSASSAFQRYQPAGEQAVAKLMPAITIPTGVSVSAFWKSSGCQREWFVRLGGWFVTVTRTDDWMRKLR
jgi:hypothetical protein